MMLNKKKSSKEKSGKYFTLYDMTFREEEEEEEEVQEDVIHLPNYIYCNNKKQVNNHNVD